jgi:hypothetical protein
MQKTRQVFYEPEKDCWMIMVMKGVFLRVWLKSMVKDQGHG